MHIYGFKNRYYRGVVQGTTKEKYYNVLFDDGSFCNDLRSADIVVSTILAMCDIYKFILSGQSGVRHKERDLVQKYRLYVFPVKCGPLNIQCFQTKV